MKTILHTSGSRGHANHGWLDTYHTFSFGQYYDPNRVHFGVLRVLNDDTVSGGMGFGKHPHDNMEIISIPLEGDLKHQDSMGNTAVIKQGDIQVMSAGTGIYHSEQNANAGSPVKFLQIWVIPNKKNVTPRYDQITLDAANSKNQLEQIVSPHAEDAGVWIHQDAWFHIGSFDKGIAVEHAQQLQTNGTYFFVLEGSFEINGQILDRRDGLGIEESNTHMIKSLQDGSRLLVMEVPMR
jgi:redox-sensitive bicupin YhaK (pirin superfamily)